MASDTDGTPVTEFTEENVEQTGLSGVEKKKETDILLLQIKKRKRTEKTKVTKLRHELERVSQRFRVFFLSSFDCDFIIFGGDFNLVCDIHKDKKGGIPTTHSSREMK